KPYGKTVEELICGEGMRDANGPANFLLRYDAKPADLAGAVGEQFLGITLRCAQCHNHPYTAWKQEDFWGLAAYFTRLKMLQNAEDNSFTGGPEAPRAALEIPPFQA